MANRLPIMDRDGGSLSGISGVYRDPADRMARIPVPLSFAVDVNGRAFRGLGLSRDALFIEAGQRHHHGYRSPYRIVAVFRIAEGVITVRAIASECGHRKDGVACLEFVSMSDADREGVLSVLRAAESLARQARAELAEEGSPRVPPVAMPYGRLFWINALALSVAAILSLGCLFYLSLAVVMANFSVRSSYAALTVPRVDIRSLEASRRIHLFASTGKAVDRDEAIGRLDSALLDAEIEALRTSINDRGGTSNSDERAVSRQRRQSGKLAYERESSIGRAPVNNSARSELAVLELRRTLLDIRSPCKCLVLWMAVDGQAVVAGELIAVLARIDASEQRVDAFIPVEAISSVVVGQPASVHDPQSGQRWSARVSRLRLGDETRPRAGVPAAARASSGLAVAELVLEGSPGPEFLGRPLEVIFRKWW